MAEQKASPEANKVLLQGLMTSRNPVIVADHQGQIYFANPACERLLGYERGELLGEYLAILYPSEAQQKLRRILREAMLKRFAQGELELVRRDGTRFGGQVSMTPLQNEGEEWGIIVINRDTSSPEMLRKELEQQNEELAVRDEILRIQSRAPHFEAGLEEALERTLQLAGFGGGLIALVEGERGILIPRVQRGIPPALMRDLRQEPLRLDGQLIGPVMKRGEPLIIEDLNHDERVVRAALKESGLRSAVIIPILAKKEVVGLLFLLDQRPLAVSLERLHLLQAVGNQMGITMENMQLFLRERRRFSQLLLVGGIARKASSILDLERLLDEVAREIQRAFNYWDVVIFFVDEDRGELVRKAWAGNYHRRGPKEERIPIADQGILRWVVHHGRTALVKDVKQDLRYKPFFSQTKSELCVPLRGDGRVIGGINVESIQENDFDETDAAVLETLADQLVVAIDNAELYRKLGERVARRTAALRTSQERLQALSQVAAKIQGVLDEERILTLATEELGKLGFIASFWSVEKDGEAIIRRHFTFQPRLLAAIRRVTGSGPTGFKLSLARAPHLIKAIKQGEVVVVDDVKKTLTYRLFRSDPQTLEELEREMQGVIYAPLLIRGEAVWLMTASLSQAAEEDVRTVETFARHLSIALENARLFQELHSSYGRLKQIQEELLQAERLAAIGQLAGSIGHQLRNPLGVIRNSIFYLKSKLGKREGKIREHLELIDEEILCADRRISELLTFAYRGRPRFRKVKLKPLVERALAETEIPAEIELMLDFSGGPLLVEVDPEQMLQVYCNIINNALQAMVEGGKLLIRGYQEEGEAVLEFEDNGAGLAKGKATRVFEPLFTTKAQGSGLGLTICKQIIEAHGGRIDFESREGIGTRITLWIPKEGAKRDG